MYWNLFWDVGSYRGGENIAEDSKGSTWAPGWVWLQNAVCSPNRSPSYRTPVVPALRLTIHRAYIWDKGQFFLEILPPRGAQGLLQALRLLSL